MTPSEQIEVGDYVRWDGLMESGEQSGRWLEGEVVAVFKTSISVKVAKSSDSHFTSVVRLIRQSKDGAPIFRRIPRLTDCRCHVEAGDSECQVHPPPPEELAYAASIGAPYTAFGPSLELARQTYTGERKQQALTDWASTADLSAPTRPDGFAQSRIDEIKAMMLATGRKR